MQKKIFIVLSLLLVTIILFLALQNTKKTPDATSNMVSDTPTPTQTVTTVSNEEQQAIERWIKQNNLNFFGDSMDTAYSGGTPLYNEMTGERIERFTYIVEKHPDKPWNN